jgi:hypothetical protein
MKSRVHENDIVLCNRDCISISNGLMPPRLCQTPIGRESRPCAPRDMQVIGCRDLSGPWTLDAGAIAEERWELETSGICTGERDWTTGTCEYASRPWCRKLSESGELNGGRARGGNGPEEHRIIQIRTTRSSPKTVLHEFECHPGRMLVSKSHVGRSGVVD